MKDTVRLIMHLECNMRCSYCCNEQRQFTTQFQKKRFWVYAGCGGRSCLFDFAPYRNVCITGGEPFLQKDELFMIMDVVPEDKNIYLYTNGLLINNEDIEYLQTFANLKCVNVGLHTLRQLKAINKNLERLLPVRFMARDTNCAELLRMYPERLNADNLKAWELNKCDMPNEDWVFLI